MLHVRDDRQFDADLHNFPAALIAGVSGFVLRGLAIARGWSLPAYRG